MNIIVVTNVKRGAGLEKHGIILNRRLTDLGHAVDVVDYLSRNKGKKYDLAIHVELLAADWINCAAKNWWIPNIEWCIDYRNKGMNFRFIAKMDLILSQTNYGNSVLQELFGDKVKKLGFESIDYGFVDNPERKFFHATGMNQLKGVSALAGLPITVINKRVEESDYRTIQRKHLFHIYPSEAESWCHAVHEAFGMGLLVCTFGEWDDFNGSIVQFIAEKRNIKRGFIYPFNIDKLDVSSCMTALNDMSDDEVSAARKSARVAFEAESLDFVGNLTNLVGTV